MRPRENKPLLGLGAGVFVISPEGKMLLVQQERVGRRKWGPLGGRLEDGESIEECALREAREESGLRVRLMRLLSVDQFWHGGEFRGVGFDFLAEPDPWPQPVVIPEYDGSARFLDYRWVCRDEGPTYLPDNDWELWTQYWPPDIGETLVRKLEFET